MNRPGWAIRARRVALPVAAALFVGAAGAGAESDPSCGRMPVVPREGTLVYRLPHAFLRPGSDSVRVGAAVWRRDADYALNPLRGELRLLRDPIPGDTLWVEACWLLDPPPLERERRRYRPGPPEAQGAAPDSSPAVVERAGVSRERFSEASGLSLAVSGSKTLAIDFGSNQDAFVRQSLDLTLGGQLAPGVELTGVLSDRNTPLPTAA